MNTVYKSETPKAVINWLETSRERRQRIRVFYGDIETGRDWMEEYDTIGHIGRSTGTQSIPLLIKSERSFGGGSILDHCIVRITVDKKDVYRHPNYNQPEMKVIEANMITDEKHYQAEVTFDGEAHARFETKEQAERWVQFMKGERNSK